MTKPEARAMVAHMLVAGRVAIEGALVATTKSSTLEPVVLSAGLSCPLVSQFPLPACSSLCLSLLTGL